MPFCPSFLLIIMKLLLNVNWFYSRLCFFVIYENFQFLHAQANLYSFVIHQLLIKF
ncbi:hypothetical protein D0Y65_032515, partial [Glycine soja]